MWAAAAMETAAENSCGDYISLPILLNSMPQSPIEVCPSFTAEFASHRFKSTAPTAIISRLGYCNCAAVPQRAGFTRRLATGGRGHVANAFSGGCGGVAPR